MSCPAPSAFDQLVCAVQALKPEWWEQWLPAVALLVSAVVPILIAFWVARDARKTTLTAVNMQIAADRQERHRDSLRARVNEFAQVVNRQPVIDSDSWKTESLAVSAVSTALSISLPWDVRQKLDQALSDAAPDLLGIRAEQLAGNDEEGAGLFSWVARYRTLADMILTEQPPQVILQMYAWMKSEAKQPGESATTNEDAVVS